MFDQIDDHGSPGVFYRQCVLAKGDLTTVSWIPEKFAVVGKALRLKENSIWDDGWTVEEVGGRREECELPDHRKEIKAHRKRSGDSLPKSGV